jgi:hypothetical protein
MQVTNVRVSFLREKQPAQFEKSRPEVEFAAALDQGDDHLATARQLMTDAATVVYAGIGYAVPDRVAQALASGVVPAELSVATETTEAAEAAPEAAEEATEPKKGRGRPKGSKNTAPKKETAAAKRKREAAEAEAAKEADTDGIPGDDEPSAISTGEARVGPEDDPADHGVEDDGIPGEDEAPAEEAETEFTPKDLHTLIMSHVNATPRTLSVANAKQVLAHFKVARAQDLTNEQALEGKALVEKMVAAAGEG